MNGSAQSTDEHAFIPEGEWEKTPFLRRILGAKPYRCYVCRNHGYDGAEWHYADQMPVQ